MARLAADERKFYGHTLIKLLEGFSAAPLCPGLVPFITNKQIIKRRIAMISKFKPAGRPALAGSISLLLALAGFTFTRAAGQSNEAPKPDNPTTSSSAPAASDAERQRRLEPKERLIAVLNEQLDRLSAVVRIEQDELSDLRKKLNIPNDVAEGKAVSKVDSETMHHYDDLVMDAESQYVQQEKLLSELKKLPMEELKNTMPTAAPDATLTQLLQNENDTEQNLARLRGEFGEQNPEVMREVKLQEEVKKQINDRLKGILQGMETRAAALKAMVDNLKAKIETARKDDSDSFDNYRPYFQLKRDLEARQKERDLLMARLDQEKIDLEVSKADPAR
jgi:uncharacterized protein involved in exopolysaccharide biosynthesis